MHLAGAIPQRRRRQWPAAPSAPVALLVVAALLPFGLDAGSDVLNDLTIAGAYALMALGLNVVVGFTGLLDLGYVAFYAIGAYTAAYVASGYWVPGIHLDFLLVLGLAIAATTVAGVLIGIPTLRLKRDYVAIVTLAFGEIIGRVATNGRDISLFGGTLTPGPVNIGPIDPVDLPGLAPFGNLSLRPWYWCALVLVVLAVVTVRRLRGSRIGRAWIAVREDEEAAAGAGIHVARAKLAAYATGGAFGGVAGAFLASYLSVVNAEQFQFSFSIFIFSMVVLGGLGSIPGVIAGAVVLSGVNSHLLPDVVAPLPSTLGIDFDPSVVTSGLYGVIIVLVMLLRPQGIVPAR